jgi:hypothetical protein
MECWKKSLNRRHLLVSCNCKNVCLRDFSEPIKCLLFGDFFNIPQHRKTQEIVVLLSQPLVEVKSTMIFWVFLYYGMLKKVPCNCKNVCLRDFSEPIKCFLFGDFFQYSIIQKNSENSGTFIPTPSGGKKYHDFLSISFLRNIEKVIK